MTDPNPKGISLHIPVLITIQVCFIILFGVFSRYDYQTVFKNQSEGDYGKGTDNSHNMILKIYSSFQDVHVMIFIGFGFLMTFLKKYGLSAVSLNFMIAAICIQWHILVSGWLHLNYDQCEEEFHGQNDTQALTMKDDTSDKLVFNQLCDPNRPFININIETLIGADFCVATVLITFGVVLGVASPLQLIIMTMIEVVIFNVNEYIGRNYIGTVDAGDTIFVHMFGAYFGLAMSRILYDNSIVESKNPGTDHQSNLFSMIGTIFLWCYWPSFNGGTAATGDAQQRAFINTYLSLCACCVTTFAVSAAVNPKRKFVMEHLQNATLAGGVAVGAAADMMLSPFGAIVMGTLAGLVSTIGFEYLTPLLAQKLKITDTCGVHNLHGMPSVLGGFLSILIAGIATREEYDQFNVDGSIPEKSSLNEIFPLVENENWTNQYQAGLQAAGMGLTLIMAIVSGVVTGFILKLIKTFEQKSQDMWNRHQRDYLYHDDLYFYRDYEIADDKEIEKFNCAYESDVDLARKV